MVGEREKKPGKITALERLLPVTVSPYWLCKGLEIFMSKNVFYFTTYTWSWHFILPLQKSIKKKPN